MLGAAQLTVGLPTRPIGGVRSERRDFGWDGMERKSQIKVRVSGLSPWMKLMKRIQGCGCGCARALARLSLPRVGPPIPDPRTDGEETPRHATPRSHRGVVTNEHAWRGLAWPGGAAVRQRGGDFPGDATLHATPRHATLRALRCGAEPSGLGVMFRPHSKEQMQANVSYSSCFCLVAEAVRLRGRPPIRLGSGAGRTMARSPGAPSPYRRAARWTRIPSKRNYGNGQNEGFVSIAYEMRSIAVFTTAKRN